MSSTSPKSPRNDEPKAPERRPPTRDAAAPGVEDPFRRIAPREAPPPLLPAQERAWAAALQRAHGNSMATELLLARQAVTNGQAGLPHAELDAHTGGLGRRPGAVDFTSAPVQLRVGDEFRNSAPQEKLSTTSAAKLNTLGQIQDFVGSDKYKSMEVELGKVIFENLAVFSEAIGPVTDWILRYLEATGAAGASAPAGYVIAQLLGVTS